MHKRRNDLAPKDTFSQSEVHISRIAHFIEQLANHDRATVTLNNYILAQKPVAPVVNVYSFHMGSYEIENQTICEFIFLFKNHFYLENSLKVNMKPFY